jgi:hypothetical protein
MNPREPFAEGLENAVTVIRDMLPETLIDLFEAQSTVSAESFLPIAPSYAGTVAAVDGSHAIICDGGHFSIGIIRAAASMFQGGIRSRLQSTPVRLVMLGPGRENGDFSEIYQESFQRTPPKPLINEDPVRTCGVLRETLEYAAAYLLAHSLSAGDTLLLDGALRVSHAALHPILEEIQVACGRRDVLLAAVTKKTAAAWGDGHPLLPAVGGLAAQYGIRAPWYVHIPESILDSTPTEHYTQGEIFVGKLSPDAPRGFKVELPAGTDEEKAARTFTALAAYAGDARLPGYPYPLADAHRTSLISVDLAEEVRQGLLQQVAGTGMGYAEFQDLFGDYHDELARY